MLNENFILRTDAYKQTHWLQYPKGTEYVYSYMESRGGGVTKDETNAKTVFFGLQMLLKKYLCGVVVTKEMIDEAEEFCAGVFGTRDYFNRAGWEHIVNKHGGRLPLVVRAVPEGLAIPTHNVLMTICNTDPAVPFITNFVESILLKVWYPTTVASLSWEIRKLVTRYAEATGGAFNPFFLNDFGYRGVSSEESAEFGGTAHLVNFMGTDTLMGIRAAMRYYSAKVCGHSVMAAEHSTVTAYGRDKEAFAYETFLDRCPSDMILSIVSDSYDLHNAVEKIFGHDLKDKILKREGKLVVRPDSGDPATVSVETLESLWRSFGGTTNDKGYRVLNPKVGVIYGDGINYFSIEHILMSMQAHKFAASNIVFGMGGALLQQLNRDTFKFAIKCSAIDIDGKWWPVYKEPKTDSGKNSKRGMLALVKKDTGYATDMFLSAKEWSPNDDVLVEVFRDGELRNKTTFDEVRKRAEESLKE
jgi:nicotinamide phosphoribosyltransferase